MGADHRFNFTQLNARTADLHLLVAAAKKDHLPRLIPARQIAGAVDACAGTEGVRAKAFGR